LEQQELVELVFKIITILIHIRFLTREELLLFLHLQVLMAVELET
jgi:hypothetical protein